MLAPAAAPPAAAPERPGSGSPRIVYQGLVTGNVAPGRVATLPGSTPAAKETPPKEPATDPSFAAIDAASASSGVVPARLAARSEPSVAPARAPSGRIGLNTASVSELSGLGAGMIGRAIVAERPYASPEDLIEKRVLNRGTYARVKEQVAAR